MSCHKTDDVQSNNGTGSAKTVRRVNAYLEHTFDPQLPRSVLVSVLACHEGVNRAHLVNAEVRMYDLQSMEYDGTYFDISFCCQDPAHGIVANIDTETIMELMG